MNNLLRMNLPVLLLLAVTTYSMPASAIDSEFLSLKELAQKANDAMRDIKDGITGNGEDGYVGRPGQAPSDSEDKRRNLFGLIFILVGTGFLMAALSVMHWRFGGVMPFVPGLLLVLFLWWLFPFLPVFLLFIPLIGIRFMRRDDHPSRPSYQPTRPPIPPVPPGQQDYVREPEGQEGSSHGHVIGMPEPIYVYSRETHRRHDNGPYQDYGVGSQDEDGPHL